MVARLGPDHRGFSLLEVLIGTAVGLVVLMGLSSLYVTTVRALDESSSQAAIQRVGMLAIQVITRQAARATSNPITPPVATCVPAGTTSRSLLLRVVDTSPPSLPATQRGTYCYYAGNGANGAPAGALCQRVIDDNGTTSPCWNLLAAAQPGLTRLPRQTGVSLIQQTNPVNLFCPRNTADNASNPVAGGQVIATGVHCLAFSMNPPGTQQAGDIAFAITDGLSSMTFTESLMLQNHP